MSNDPSHPSLSLEQVTKGFSEAEKTIRDLRGRFSRLVNASEAAENQSRNMQEASTSLQQLGRSLEELIRVMAVAQTRMNEITTSAAGVLEGSDLKQLGEAVSRSHTRLDRLEQGIQESFNRQDEKSETLAGSTKAAILDRIEALEDTAVKASESEKEAGELRAELERVKGILGWRQRRKLGYQKE